VYQEQGQRQQRHRKSNRLLKDADGSSAMRQGNPMVVYVSFAYKNSVISGL